MRVLQLNLWNINNPLTKRMDILTKGISLISPDIITFQEVSPIKGSPQIESIAKKLGYNCYYADAGSFRGRREGNAILSRTPAVACETLNLGFQEVDLQRVALCCFFKVKGGRNHAVVTTHLAYPLQADEARIYQAKELVKFINSTGAVDNFILGADLNAIPSSRAVREIMMLPKAIDAWDYVGREAPEYTFARDNPFVEERLGPDRRIDYIIVGGGVSIKKCQVVFTSSSHGIVSDHYGLLVDLNLPQ